MGIRETEALELFRSDDLIGLAMEADALRRHMHPEGVVPYTVAAAIACGDSGRTCAEAAEAADRGASAISLTGAGRLAPENLSALIATLRRDLPDVSIHALNAQELSSLAAAQDLADLLKQLRGRGLDSLLVEAPDPTDPAATEAWFGAHAAAHGAGIRTVGVLSFGGGESLETRVATLARIDALQQRTGAFAAFLAEPVASGLAGPTAVDSLKTLAIARLMLGSIEHIRVTHRQALKVLETGLRFGADDAGQLFIDTHDPPDLREEDLRRVIRDAGFRPAERSHDTDLLAI